ncbi:MAG TPA: helix-turn-helix domain-containing protein [Acidimicrobiales bacterium]|nr:helix-turn-helix domain-containing protein [Acidimicrobiales bacterium]
MTTPATRSDPFQALGEALQAVVEDAVAKALASVRVPSTEDAVMLSVPEAAERLGVGTTKVKQLIASGQLASVTIGRRRLVPAAIVRSFGSCDGDRGLAS